MRSDCPNGFTAWTPIQTFTTTGTARLSQTDGVASLDLYPNPATGFTFLNYDAAGLGNVEMAVYDAFGRIMFSQRVSDETGTIRLDTHGWPSGTYSIRLGNGSNAAVTKLTVIK